MFQLRNSSMKPNQFFNLQKKPTHIPIKRQHTNVFACYSYNQIAPPTFACQILIQYAIIISLSVGIILCLILWSLYLLFKIHYAESPSTLYLLKYRTVLFSFF